jgi:hypothetical protein
MKGRWLVLVAATTALVLGGSLGVRAVVNQNQHRLNRQRFTVLAPDGAKTTAATTWRIFPGWSFSDTPSIDARGGIAATLSVTATGAPVDFRLTLEVERGFNDRTFSPRFATFDPGSGTESFSYTFVIGVGSGQYKIGLSWRSPTGVSVTVPMRGGNVVLQYATSS